MKKKKQSILDLNSIFIHVEPNPENGIKNIKINIIVEREFFVYSEQEKFLIICKTDSIRDSWVNVIAKQICECRNITLEDLQTPPLKEGYLEIESRKKKRWYQLWKLGVLRYYEKPNGALKGSIEITGCNVRITKHCEFEIQTSSIVYLLNN